MSARKVCLTLSATHIQSDTHGATQTATHRAATRRASHRAAIRVRNSKTSISWETCSTFDTLKLKIDDFLRQSQNAAPATTFDTVTRSRSLANAISQNCTFGTSQSAAPATRLDNRPAQTAATAMITVTRF